MGCILLLSKVLPHLHALSKISQHDHTCYSTLWHCANNTNELPNELAQLLHEGKVTSHHQVELQNTAIQYCATLWDNINRRFDEASPVLEAFSVFDPVCLLQTKYASFKTYSHEHVSTLCKLFGFDEDEARAQWDNFKYLLWKWKDSEGECQSGGTVSVLSKLIKEQNVHNLMQISINGPHEESKAAASLIEGATNQWAISTQNLCRRQLIIHEVCVLDLNRTNFNMAMTGSTLG